jgi:hypothetical protein
MAILPTDVKYFLSGGSGNTDPNQSLGGAISTTQFTDAMAHNMFADVEGTETTTGSTKYRCIYVKNGHATLTMQTASFFVNAEASSPENTINIGVGTSGLNGIEQVIADENTAPIDVTFNAPINAGTGLNLGNIGPGKTYALWFQRIVNQSVSRDYFGNTFVWEIDFRSSST